MTSTPTTELKPAAALDDLADHGADARDRLSERPHYCPARPARAGLVVLTTFIFIHQTPNVWFATGPTSSTTPPIRSWSC